MEFSTPTWDAKNSVYKIRIINTAVCLESEPQYLDLSGGSKVDIPDMNTEDFKGACEAFVSALITKDGSSKWFATRLKESSVLKRLAHKWADPPPAVSPLLGWFTSMWRPTLVEIGTSGFTLHWQIVGFENTEPQISSRFLPTLSGPPSPVPEEATPTDQKDLKQITIQGGNELETVYDIPFTNENTAIDFNEQLRDKESLQEAKLRLALAKLKAQRLARSYYDKYGEAEEDEDEEEDD
jgi:hypothetical protein